jgi:hypothetical protein
MGAVAIRSAGVDSLLCGGHTCALAIFYFGLTLTLGKAVLVVVCCDSELPCRSENSKEPVLPKPLKSPKRVLRDAGIIAG